MLSDIKCARRSVGSTKRRQLASHWTLTPAVSDRSRSNTFNTVLCRVLHPRPFSAKIGYMSSSLDHVPFSIRVVCWSDLFKHQNSKMRAYHHPPDCIMCSADFNRMCCEEDFLSGLKLFVGYSYRYSSSTSAFILICNPAN